VADIAPVANITGLESTTPLVESNKEQGYGFGEMLYSALQEVDGFQKQADQAAIELASGRSTDIHGTMIAMEKADVAFQLIIQIRNRIVSAYEEVMRMQV